MKALTLTLLLLSAAPLFSQGDPAKTLFDLGIRAEQEGKLARARLTMITLAQTYTADPLSSKAREEIGAILLFQEAQSQVTAGHANEAYSSFRTVMRVYPESPLAKLADDTSKTLGIPPDPRK